jgi:hypothetical protein
MSTKMKERLILWKDQLTLAGASLAILVVIVPLFLVLNNAINTTNDTAMQLTRVESRVDYNSQRIAEETSNRIAAGTLEKEERRTDNSKVLIKIAEMQISLGYIQQGVDEIKIANKEER